MAVGGSQIYVEIDAGSPQEAESTALKKCEAKAGVPCKIWGESAHGVAIVVWRGPEGWGMEGHPDPLIADEMAKERCEKHTSGCRRVIAGWDSGHHYASLATASDFAAHVSYGATTKTKANSEALAGCEKITRRKGSCAISAKADIYGPMHIVYVQSEAMPVRGFAWDLDEEKAKNDAMQSCRSQPPKPRDCKITKQFKNTDSIAEPASMKKLVVDR